MKKITITLSLVFAVTIMLTGCGNQSVDNAPGSQDVSVDKEDESSESTTSTGDINTDMGKYFTCFSENFKTCTPVKCVFKSEAEGEFHHFIKEIKGMKDEKCEVYTEIKIYDGQPVKDMNATCLYTEYAKGDIFEKPAECTGNMADDLME